MDGLKDFPLPQLGFSVSHLCTLPVDMVLCFPCVDCDSIVGIRSLHHQLVFSYPLLQCSSCLSYVSLITPFARDLVYYSFLLEVRGGSLHSDHHHSPLHSPPSPILTIPELTHSIQHHFLPHHFSHLSCGYLILCFDMYYHS